MVVVAAFPLQEVLVGERSARMMFVDNDIDLGFAPFDQAACRLEHAAAVASVVEATAAVVASADEAWRNVGRNDLADSS